MRLSWNEIRARAAKFSHEWATAHYEKGETQSFYNAFFDVFGTPRRRVAMYEQQVKKLNGNTGFIDLFWPSVLLVEQKSAGHNLAKAKTQALDYCLGLSDDEHPRYILVSDFQNFSLFDLETNEDLHFPLAELSRHVEKFGFITGVQKRAFRAQDPVNIRASEMMAHVHDGLKAAHYTGHDLEQFLVCLLFCLFADDTGIFERDILLDYLDERTNVDGSDLGAKLSELFQVLNTPEDKRQSNLDEDLAAFPYINGELFAAPLRIPAFNSKLRAHLIAASRFDWGKVSPAIFGSLFQGVMDSQRRREQGAHYTSEQDILKVIEPLFMDELRAEFETLKKRKTKRKKSLEAFHEKLSGLTFFDPACGCGNFLVIAYRELRQLEIELLQAMHPRGQQELNVEALSKIDVHQFYGIELEEFPVRIAETAMWMMDHIMNNELSLAFGQSFTRIPLKKSPHILQKDALETDWHTHLPAQKCHYVFGNPPFGGSKLQSPVQRAQVRDIAKLGGSGGTLDYVAAWFLKAGAYVQNGTAKIGFVATNSIIQGEQVGMLWPLLFERYKLDIAFAHRTFMWKSEARGTAHVHVVIIGLTRADNTPKEKRLFSYPDIKAPPEESRHEALAPYLFDARGLANRHLVVTEQYRPINDLPRMIIGSQPIDNGHYIFTEEEKSEFLAKEPAAEKFMRPYIGAKEYIQGRMRWVLFLQNAAPNELKNLSEIKARMAMVKEFRAKRKSKPTQQLALTPTLYNHTVIPETPFLMIPRVSSERRDYIPIGWLAPPIIPSDAALVIPDASLDLFGLLTSAMHMAWMRAIGGRLKSDYRYSAGMVYNTFPMPQMTEGQKKAIGKRAQAVLDARAKHSDSTLATLYDPDLMPPDLRKAHSDLDSAVDRLYKKGGFDSERARVEHLFMLYEKMMTPLIAVKPKRRHKR